MEKFYYTGMKLKEIRDDELYKEDGFTTWKAYCRERWNYSRDYVHKLITASEYRIVLPAPSDVYKLSTSESLAWSEGSVRELTRIPDKKQAARVATKVIKAVEASAREATKDPQTKPLKFSAATVRRFVDEDLGITKAKPRKAEPRVNGVDLLDYINRQIGTIEGVRDVLKEIPDDGWESFREEHPGMIRRLISACSSLTALLREAEGR
jgi:hypothetical protein